MVIEIVILAMIAAFLGMRLYSVLGRKAEHEEEAISARVQQQAERQMDTPTAPNVAPAADRTANDAVIGGFPPAIERGLRDISAADRSFDVASFMDGAKASYEMALEAFWKGDRETLRELADDDVYESFTSVIEEREAAGMTLDNRLIRIEDSTIHSADMDGKTARIAVLFISDIASVTRDKDGNVVAGSLDDAVESRDVWTFSRDVRSDSPQWLLDETDIG